MLEKLKRYMETNRKMRIIEAVTLVLLLISSVFFFAFGSVAVNEDPGEQEFRGTREMTRLRDEESCDEDSRACDVIYSDGDYRMVISCPYEEFENRNDTVTACEYGTSSGTVMFFDHMDPGREEIVNAFRQVRAEEMMPLFNAACSMLILAASVSVMLFFGGFFTVYEKCWFLTIMVLATVISVYFPEESANGVSGIVIMLLYLLDTLLNILCELLISKQSRYNFLVSVAVEITEILISLVLMYRFATMAVTLLFWLPIDIISYINWTRHKDDEQDELTAVRRLKGWQEVLVICGIAVWTVAVGWLLSGLDISTDFLGGSRSLELAIIYLDACASAVGIANGLFIFFRLREQWIAWYVCALLEAVMNILAGQYVLLVLKLGYFTNTTYGYIRWSRYIREHQNAENSLF